MGTTYKILIQHKGISAPQLSGLRSRPYFLDALRRLPSPHDPLSDPLHPKSNGCPGEQRVPRECQGEEDLRPRTQWPVVSTSDEAPGSVECCSSHSSGRSTRTSAGRPALFRIR